MRIDRMEYAGDMYIGRLFSSGNIAVTVAVIHCQPEYKKKSSCITCRETGILKKTLKGISPSLERNTEFLIYFIDRELTITRTDNHIRLRRYRTASLTELSAEKVIP